MSMANPQGAPFDDMYLPQELPSYKLTPETRWDVYLVICKPRITGKGTSGVEYWALYFDASNPADPLSSSKFTQNADGSYEFQKFFGLVLHVGASVELQKLKMCQLWWNCTPTADYHIERLVLLGSISNVFQHQTASSWITELQLHASKSFHTQMKELYGDDELLVSTKFGAYYGTWSAQSNCHTWVKQFAHQCSLEVPQYDTSQEIPLLTDFSLSNLRPVGKTSRKIRNQCIIM